MFSLNNVSSIKKTNEEGVFIVSCNITDLSGQTYDCDYCSRPDDQFGLNPIIRQWLSNNPNFPMIPYSPPDPPTPEELRERMQPLSARQFRLGLVAGGKTPAQVTAVIDAMPEGVEKETAKIEWEYATTFNRTHPLIATLGGALGLTPEDIDGLWENAINL